MRKEKIIAGDVKAKSTAIDAKLEELKRRQNDYGDDKSLEEYLNAK